MTEPPSGPPTPRRSAKPESGVICTQPVDSEVPSYFARGDACFERSDFASAAREYVAAIDLLQSARRGELLPSAYLRLGRANQARGRASAAVHCYKKVLELEPQHRGALRMLIQLHAEWQEWVAVTTVEERLFETLGRSEESVTDLFRSGDRWWKDAQDPEMAKRRFRAALRLALHGPDRELVLARLRAIADAADHSEMAALRRAVMAARSDRERALAYFELGSAAWFEAHDHREAVASFEAAFTCDPTMIGAVEMLVTVLVTRRDFGKLESLCANLAEADDAPSVAARATIRQALQKLPADSARSAAVRRRTLAYFERARKRG